MIESLSNGKVKEVLKLKKRSEREKKGLFLVEGYKMVEEALKNGYEIRTLFWAEPWQSTMEIPKCAFEATPEVLKKLSDTENTQAVLGVFEIPLEPDWDQLGRTSDVLILDEVQDPGNLGTIFRSADAFGLKDIVLTKGCCDPFNPKTVRATMGSIFRVRLFHCDSVMDGIDLLKERGLLICATVPRGDRTMESPSGKNMALIMGNESRGVSEEALREADLRWTIPMVGEAESLNVGVATSIVLYERMRCRQI